MATFIFLTTTGSVQDWTVPNDWNNLSNSIHVIAGGGGGSTAAGDNGRGAGGGGAYSRVDNLSFVPGATVKYRVGTGGGTATDNGGEGTDSWFGAEDYGDADVGAKGGNGGFITTGGAGGAAASGIGDVKSSGGTGGSAAGGDSNVGGGGGGAAGPGGSGTNGGRPGGGAAATGSWTQTSNGAVAAPGAGGNESTQGSLYGGGGGGGHSHTAGGVGRQGIIVIEYVPSPLKTQARIIG
jgi:hypothetical protein